MGVKYLFNSKGDWIAFIVGIYVFDDYSNWIGWMPWGNNDVVDVNGKYIGTIFENRFFFVKEKRYMWVIDFPGYPDYQSLQDYPEYLDMINLPPATKDIKIKRLIYL